MLKRRGRLSLYVGDDEAVVEQAKKKAEEAGVSLSALVVDFLSRWSGAPDPWAGTTRLTGAEAVETGNDLLDGIREGALRLLTGDISTDRAITLPHPLVQLCALVSDGSFLVAAAAADSRDMGLMETLIRRSGHPVVRIVERDLAFVRDVYQAAATHDQANRARRGLTMMQTELLRLIDRCAQVRAAQATLQLDRFSAKVEVAVDGRVYDLMEFPRTFGADLCAVAATMAEEVRGTRTPPGSFVGHLTGDLLPGGVSLVRVETSGNAAMRLRLHADATAVPEEIGCTRSQAIQLDWVSRQRGGLVLVTGHALSGRTTLARCVLANRRAEQRTVAGLDGVPLACAPERAVLTARGQDLALFGRISDKAGLDAAVALALAGTQTWVTLDAPGSVEGIARLLDLGLSQRLLLPTLWPLTVHTRLVPRLCPHCALGFSHWRERHPVAAEDVEAWLRGHGESADRAQLRNPDGCHHCQRGAHGQTVIAEVGVPSDAVLRLIGEGRLEEARAALRGASATDQDTGMDASRIAAARVAAGVIDAHDAWLEHG